MKRWIWVPLILAFFSVAANEAQSAPKQGGKLRIALLTEPAALDQMVVTHIQAVTAFHHVMETLFAFNSKNEPVPHLVESSKVSDDGKTVLLSLRRGVLFHNGKEMSAEDVVASLSRWLKYGVRAGIIKGSVDRVVADGKYTVKIFMKNAFGDVFSVLAYPNGGPIIYPKEIVENADAKPIAPANIIGTGPYKFVEWSPGRQILLTRFKDYRPRSDTANGYAGQRIAYIDNLEFVSIPEVGTRVSGLKAGDFDYSERIPADLFEEFKKNPQVQTFITKDPSMGQLFLNSKHGIMSNIKMRKAVQAALRMEPILQAAYGPRELWTTSGGSIYPENNIWYTKAGTQSFNLGDIAKAKALLKEAGYKGEPIRYMTSTDYQNFYDESVVITSQLSKAGFKVDLQVYDWPSVASRRTKPELWDMFQTMSNFVPSPLMLTFMNPNYPGWWDTPEKQALQRQLNEALDFKTRHQQWEKIQSLFYEQSPMVKTGDFFFVDIASQKIKGYKTAGHPVMGNPYFWNVWIEE